MFQLQVDLGQIILATLIATVGYLVRKQLESFTKRLDKHDHQLLNLFSDVNRLIGFVGMRKRDQIKDDFR